MVVWTCNDEKDEEPIKKAWNEPMRGKRSRGRQRLRWREVMERELKSVGLREEGAEDRGESRGRIRVADP